MDYAHYIPARRLWPALVALMLPAPAMATAIANMSELSHTVEIQTSTGYIPQVIPPGRTFRLPGRVRIRYEQKEFYLDADMEYAIWPDGFGPQRKLKNHWFR